MDRIPSASMTVEATSQLKPPRKAFDPDEAIDYCKIDNDYAVYNRVSGTLLVLNSSAFAIFDAMRQGAAGNEIARMIATNSGAPYNFVLEDIRIQVTQWHEAGLFDEQKQIRAKDPMPDCHLKTCFISGDSRLVFSSNNQHLFDLFIDLLTPLSSKALHSAEEEEGELSMTVQDGEYSVWHDGEHLFGPDEFAPARHTVIARIAALAANDGVGCIFHASAFKSNGKTFLVSGRSGAGKSTLTASIAARDAVYLADDLVAMSDHLDALYPNPVRLNVKSNSFKLISKLYPDLQTATDWNVGGVDTRYVQPTNLPKFKSCAVDYLVFPQFDPNAAAEIKPLESAHALMKLAINGIDLSRKPGEISQLVHFIARTPCYGLSYSSTNEAFEIIDQISLLK